MRRFVKISRLALTLVTALILAATPGVQAFQLNQPADSCSSSCHCGCSCQTEDNRDCPGSSTDSSCGCKMSDPQAPEEVAFEAQPRTNSNHDNQADLSYEQSDIEANYLVSDKPVEIALPDFHGPPIHLLNSVYLI